MSRRALTLPFRVASSSSPSTQQSWICRRCLATQSTAPLVPGRTSTTSPTPDELSSWKPEQILAQPLQHRIPAQYLQHSSSPLLHEEEIEQREALGLRPHTEIKGVVIDAGKMDKTVKVRVIGRRWEKRIGKYFRDYTNHLVHDPNSSLVIGDLISMHRLRVSSAVHHVVAAILAPFGTPISARPPIPSPDDRLAAYKAKRFRKLERRELRQRAADGDAEAVQALKDRGLSVVAGGAHASGGAAKTEGQARVEQSRVNRHDRKIAEKAEAKARAVRKAEKMERREERRREGKREGEEVVPVAVGETEAVST